MNSPHQRRRLPSVLFLWAISVCFLLGALLLGVVTPMARADTGSISGNVANAVPEALVGISVTAYAANGSGGWDVVSFTQTGDGGSYSLAGLPADEYRIMFRDDSNTYVQQYYNNKGDIDFAGDVAVTAGDTTPEIDATLALAGHVRGRVTNTNTDPEGLGGISVTAYRDNSFGGRDIVSFTQTDGNGDYDLGLPWGSYRIQFQDDSGAYVGEYYDDKSTADLAALVSVGLDTPADAINAQLAFAGSPIRGTVTQAGGEELAGISVNAYRDSGSGDGWPWEWVNSTRTGPGGTYTLGGLPAGTSYLVEFVDDVHGDYVTQYYDRQPTPDPEQLVAVTLGTPADGIDAVLVPAGHIRGTVSEQGVGGLANIRVAAFQSDGQNDWNYVTDVNTADDGRYDLGGLPVGTYRIAFQDDSGDHVTRYYTDAPDLDSAKDVDVTLGTPASGIDGVLAPAGHIKGTVSAQGDGLLADIFVFACTPDGHGDWNYDYGVTTAGDGSYDLGGLSAGTYRVMFWDSSGSYVTQCYDNWPDLVSADPVAVTVGATTSDIDATLLAAPNTLPGTDQTVELPADVVLTFDTVSAPGLTTLTETAVDPGPEPAPFQVAEQSYYQIQTTATFTGPITVAFPYDPTGLTLEQQQALKLMHLDGGAWVDVTTSVDTAAHIIHGSVMHLSWFAVAVDTTPPTTSAVAAPAGWTKGHVTVTLAAIDGGSAGLAATYYAVNGGLTQTYSKPIKLSGQGEPVVSYWSVDNAGNTERVQTIQAHIDTTAPVIVITAPADGATYLLNQVVKANWSASDVLSGVSCSSGTTASGAAIVTSKVTRLDARTGRPVGLTYTVTATDKVGNKACKTVTYFVSYKRPTGFLPPIDADGGSLFKLGSTVTVGFQLADANGANVPCAAATIAVARVSTTAHGTVSKPVCNTKPTTGTAFTYNWTTKQYLYYLGTRGLKAGDYRVTASLDDGTQIVGQFSLK